MRKGKISKPNKIEICGDIAKIHLTPRNGLDELIAIIDSADIEKVINTETRWTTTYTTSKYYVLYYFKDENGKYKNVYLHRLITKAPEGYLVDHINGNPLDNRRENMRIVSHGENMQNRKVHKNSKSGVRGVSWDKANNKWRATIQVNNKTLNLGRYSIIEDAKSAVIEARLKYMPFTNEAVGM